MRAPGNGCGSGTPSRSRRPTSAPSTWEEGSWRFNGHANVWGPMAVDAARGLVYFGTSTPGNDYYGGRRPGKNEPAESIVCLDITTGQRKWSFQMVHHGLWDYDNPAAPNLVTITVDGKRIDAVAQVTKQGFTYVFDRVTGEPVWPIVERPVPTDTDVPGEKVWPTQPFPTRPPPFARQGVSLEDANDLTPEIKELAQAEMKKYRLGPLFTPPSLRGTLQLPGNEGGANWGGAIWDAQTGRLYVRSKDVIRYNSVIASDGTDKFIDHAFSGHLPVGASRHQARRHSVDQAALRAPDGDRSEQGRDRSGRCRSAKGARRFAIIRC